MHAIGNYIVKNNKKKVLYVTSERFVDDFLNIYRKNKNENNFEMIEAFKKKYRDIDVLMIDDIQYLEIANKTQQEFFNTFNELHTNNKQIIISSDRSPDDLNKLEERLRTRFNWGLTIDILPPDFQLRLDIIDKKIEAKKREADEAAKKAREAAHKKEQPVSLRERIDALQRQERTVDVPRRSHRSHSYDMER